MFDSSNVYRFSMDQTLSTTSIQGVTPYQVWLIQIANDIVNYDDNTLNKTVIQTRITVGNLLAVYSAEDGFLNPIVTQENGENLVLSGGQITDNIILLGPLVYPYKVNQYSGGTNSQIFQPQNDATNNTQVFVQLRGDSLSPKGNFFEVKEIKIDDMGGISYQVVLKATITSPNLL